MVVVVVVANAECRSVTWGFLADWSCHLSISKMY